MILYLLDTNAVIAIAAERSGRVAARVAVIGRDAIGISSIVVHELAYGVYRSSRIADNLATLDRSLSEFAVLDFTGEDARASGQVRARLALSGTPIGPYDVLLAGQALARGLTFVTNNTREFHRVEGLRVEDWSQP